MLRALILFLVAGTTIAASEPRTVAEEALAAWRDGDAKRLDAVAHSEFRKRCRDARIVHFYVEGKAETKKALAAGSDREALFLFCEALRSIVPRDARVDYFDRFLETIPKGNRVIVVFESGWRLKSDPSKLQSSRQEVVLQKDGRDWRFLWSVAASIHVDLGWDPRE